jgi:outer membrane protein assembly factor BamB
MFGIPPVRWWRWLLVCWGLAVCRHIAAAPQPEGMRAEGTLARDPYRARWEACLQRAPGDPERVAGLEDLYRSFIQRLYRFEEAREILKTLIAELPASATQARAMMELALLEANLVGGPGTRESIRQGIVPLAGQYPELGEVVREFEEKFESMPLNPVSMDVSTEAMAGYRDFVRLAGEGEWGDAVALLSQLLSDHGDAVIQLDDGAIVGLRVHLRRVLAGLPSFFRGDYESRYRDEFEKAISSGEPVRMEDFLKQHPIDLFEGPLSKAIAETYLDQGKREMARGFFERSLRVLPAASETALDVRREVVEYTQPERPSGNSTLALSEVLGTARVIPIRISQEVGTWLAGWKGKRRYRMADDWVPYSAAVGDGLVFVDSLTQTLAVRWKTGETVWQSPIVSENLLDSVPQSSLEVRIFPCPKPVIPAVSGDRVFVRRQWRNRLSGAFYCPLLALHQGDGQPAWSAGSEPAAAGLDFIGNPTAAEGIVVAPAWNRREYPEVSLLAFDAASGRLRWYTRLARGLSLPMIRDFNLMDTPLGGAPPTVVEGKVYYCTEMGVVAALDLQFGEVLWMWTYPRRAEWGYADWAGRFLAGRPPGPVIPSGESVILAPRDGGGVIRLNTRTGSVEAEFSVLDLRALIGEKEGRILVQCGNRVLALDSVTLGVVWERQLPVSLLLGVPVCSPRGLLCPGTEGVAVVDTGNGEVVEFVPWPDTSLACGNLLDLGDRIVGFAADRLIVFGGGSEPASTPTKPAPRVLAAASPSTARWQPGVHFAWLLPHSGGERMVVPGEGGGYLLTNEGNRLRCRRVCPTPDLLWEIAVIPRLRVECSPIGSFRSKPSMRRPTPGSGALRSGRRRSP